ncbi:hypothetical protein [Glutamicibacter sp. FBE19]|uniref:hypothetical protein n=1 Tax=Glutamicibacter sp. FBE19 TaxID=2761534 RepID=UPI0018969492|nr:hypothetical protein [Glutamicibacter sp. FBE19]MBF6672461.1 hypothetical protein [Glutamicibacter sp. FBE19]
MGGKLKHSNADLAAEAQALRSYLALLDPSILSRKIAKYEQLARKIRSRQEIAKDIYDVIRADSGGVGWAKLPCITRTLPGGARLFRIRGIESDADVSEIKHLWQAPSVSVGAGRLNIPREPLIYTSIDSPSTAAYEVRMKPGDQFALIEYESKIDLKYALIGEYPKNDYLSVAERRKLDLILGFLKDIFTQRTHPEESHVYVAPEIVVKSYYDWPVEIAQAWGYGSVAAPSGTGYNVCFRPEVAKAYLQINKASLGTFTLIDEHQVRADIHKVVAPVPNSSKLMTL